MRIRLVAVSVMVAVALGSGTFGRSPAFANKRKMRKHYPHHGRVVIRFEKKRSIRTRNGRMVEEETATWSELRAGDCHEIEGTLTLRSDGTAHFACVTWTDSTHSGDYWRAGFTLLDHSGVTLHNGPIHASPRMDDGNGGPSPRYRWSFDYNFPAAAFGQITSARQGYSC